MKGCHGKLTGQNGIKQFAHGWTSQRINMPWGIIEPHNVISSPDCAYLSILRNASNVRASVMASGEPAMASMASKPGSSSQSRPLTRQTGRTIEGSIDFTRIHDGNVNFVGYDWVVIQTLDLVRQVEILHLC